MAIVDAIRRNLVDEDGVALVDNENNNNKALIMANSSGKGAQSFTSEYEIMRGNLVRIIYNVIKDKVKYVFGKTIDDYEQDQECVTIRFSDGQTGKFDIIVKADRQGSHIRRDIQPSNAPDPVRRLGMYSAYWPVALSEIDGNIFKMCVFPGSCIDMCRTNSPTKSQAYFSIKNNSEEMRNLYKSLVETQKQFWAQKFQGAGWQTDPLIEAMKTSETFYSHEVVQIRTDKWSRGRVVLLGDAANFPSPATGRVPPMR